MEIEVDLPEEIWKIMEENGISVEWAILKGIYLSGQGAVQAKASRLLKSVSAPTRRRR